MKKYLWLLLILIAGSSWAAQQTVTFPPDYKVRDRATKYNANFTELYRLAHDSYSSLQEYDDGDVVTSGHVLYVSLQDNNTGHPVTDAAWWEAVQTGGGGISHAPSDGNTYGSKDGAWARIDYNNLLNLPTIPTNNNQLTNGAGYISTETDPTVDTSVKIANKFTGTGDYLKSDGTRGTPTGSGDMAKSVYDIGDNGIVDNAEALLGGTWAAPGAIGSTTPAAVTGTTATFDTYTTSAADGSRYQLIWNTNDPSTTCDAAHNGAFAYRRSDNSFRYCNGSAWSPWPGGSGGGSANIVDTDPTSSSPTGEYWSRASGDLFYVVNDGGANDGIFQVAGTWTPDTVTYTLTVTDPGNGDSITCSDSDLSAAINCGNGNSDCSTTASSGANITGMTATAASGRQFDNWTGDITGSENPTTTALVMDANKSVGAAFSASSVAMSHYFKFDAAGGTGNDQVYDEITGQWVGSGATTVTFTTDDSRTVIQSNSTSGRIGVPAVDNINHNDSLTIEATVSISTQSYELYALKFDDNGDSLQLRPYRSSGNGRASIICNGGAISASDFTSPSTNTYHTIRMVIDFTNKVNDTYVDGSLVSSGADNSGIVDWTVLSGTLYFAYVNSGTDTISVDEVKIWNGVVEP